MTLKPDCLYTALLYAYNSQNENISVCIGDMPVLTHRELIAKRLKIKECQEMFTRTIDKWEMQGSDQVPQGA